MKKLNLCYVLCITALVLAGASTLAIIKSCHTICICVQCMHTNFHLQPEPFLDLRRLL